jgi:hypothetical protein
MFEFLGSGIIGSLLGGVFRLAPELLKFFDRNNDRKHELKMFTIQTDLEKQRGAFKLEERYVDHYIGQLEAIQQAFKEQSETASKSYMWVSALSALVRPMVTYTLFGLYVLLKCVTINYALAGGADWHTVLVSAWTVEDFGMLNMILTFWFVGRTIEKYQK